MATFLFHLRNTLEKPKVLKKKAKVLALDTKGKIRHMSKGTVVGTKDKVIYLRRTKDQTKSNLSIPMYTKVYTQVYQGRTKEFYSNPEWRAKADAIRASKKKTLANFTKSSIVAI